MLQYITYNPSIAGGKPIFLGTRIAVSMVLQYLAEGVSIATLLEQFPSLNQQHIQEAIKLSSLLVDNEQVIYA